MKALVIETNNLLGGGANEARIVQSLERLLDHLAPQLHHVDEVLITHHGLARPPQRERVRYVQVPAGTGYYAAKNVGLDATAADIVVFGDADCVPASDWLEKLLAPFADPAVQVSAGRTTYRDDLFGAAATTIDFMYFQSPRGQGNTRNFYANNVAFRRETFLAHRYRDADGIYRGHCQILGLRLQEEGVAVRYVHEAHTVHRFPDSLRELLTLRLLRGKDAVGLTPHLSRAYLPKALRKLPGLPLGVLAARFGFSVNAIGTQGLSPVRGARYLGCVAMIAGLSLVDAAGAVFGANAPESLSYHGATL